MMPFAAMRLRSSASGGAPLLLDTLTGAGIAYSVRKLRTAHAGACIRVRRSSDNAEMDVGFASNALDTATMLAWSGADSVFVTTWYDQSGNALDAVMTTAGSQPRIANAGVLEVQNTKPAPRFDGTDDRLATATYGSNVLNGSGHPFSICAVQRSLRTSQASEGIVALDRNSVQFDFESGYILERRTTNLSNALGSGSSGNAIGRQTADSNVSALSMLHYMLTPITPAETFYIDKVSKTLSNAYVTGSGSVAGFLNSGSGAHRVILGSRSGNTTRAFSDPFQGHIAEVVMWPTNQSSNRAAIETSQSGYFGTP